MSTTTEYFALLARQIQEINPVDSSGALHTHLSALRQGEPQAVDNLYQFLSQLANVGAVDSESVAPVLELLSENRDRYSFMSDLSQCA